MIGTLISFILALYIGAEVFAGQVVVNAGQVALFTIVVGSVFLVVAAFVNVLMMVPLQRSEADLTPKVVEVVKRDRRLRLVNSVLMLFPLLSFLLAFVSSGITDSALLGYLFAGWIVVVGITTDTLRQLFRIIIRYLSPSDVVAMLSLEAQGNATAGDERAMCSWIDALTETALKALDRVSTSLAIDAVNGVTQSLQRYLEASTDRANGAGSSKERDDIDDQVSYALFYAFQRLQSIHHEALGLGYEPVCSATVTALGKIAVFAGKYSLKMAGYPLHFVREFALVAVDEGLKDVGIRASCTIQEVAKVLVEECDLTAPGFQELFVGIVKHLDTLAKAIFKSDKTTSIPVLMAPFTDLKKVLDVEKVRVLPDYSRVVRELDAVIDEFSALAHVMVNLPFDNAKEAKNKGAVSSSVGKSAE